MHIRIRTLSPQLQMDYQSMLSRIIIFQGTVNGCCDFIAQCVIVCVNHCTYHPFYSRKSAKIYRCWIVWGQNILVVIIPSFLAIAYFGIYLLIWFDLMSRSQFIASSYLASTTWRKCICYLGGPHGPNKFRPVHGREYPSDGLDFVQDRQGVLESLSLLRSSELWAHWTQPGVVPNFGISFSWY